LDPRLPSQTAGGDFFKALPVSTECVIALFHLERLLKHPPWSQGVITNHTTQFPKRIAVM